MGRAPVPAKQAAETDTREPVVECGDVLASAKLGEAGSPLSKAPTCRRTPKIFGSSAASLHQTAPLPTAVRLER